MQQMRYRRDPAPSLLSYRLGRLWLRPSFRRLVKFGPIVALVVGLVVYLSTNQGFKAAVISFGENVREHIIGREEFRVTNLQVRGASQKLKTAVIGAANLELPRSSLEIDLLSLRERIEALPSVAGASVRVGQAGLLQINVSERVPAIVWRSEDGLMLFGADGVELGSIGHRLDRADLPLIAGQGANDNIGEALELFSIAAPVKDRIRGLQRVGKRRWTLILDREQQVHLPEKGATRALMRIMGTHKTQDLLSKDVKIVDMRDPLRPVLRLGPIAATEIRSRNIVIEEGSQ